MFAIDTSTLIAFLQGAEGKDVQLFIKGLRNHEVSLPQVVVSELLSDPNLDSRTLSPILKLPRLLIELGFWERAGINRSKVLAKKLKAKLADSLIAQSCLDYDCRLITRDNDFKNFVSCCGLKLATI